MAVPPTVVATKNRNIQALTTAPGNSLYPLEMSLSFRPPPSRNSSILTLPRCSTPFSTGNQSLHVFPEHHDGALNVIRPSLNGSCSVSLYFLYYSWLLPHPYLVSMKLSISEQYRDKSTMVVGLRAQQEHVFYHTEMRYTISYWPCEGCGG